MFAVCRVSGGIQVVSNTDFLRNKNKSFFFFSEKLICCHP